MASGHGEADVSMSAAALFNAFTTTRATISSGAIRDPQLARFKGYGVPSEIPAVGYVLADVFVGRDALNVDGADAVSLVVRKCTSAGVPARYASVLGVVADIELLPAAPRLPPDPWVGSRGPGGWWARAGVVFAGDRMLGVGGSGWSGGV